MEKYIDKLILPITDRLKHPIVTSFIISWIFFNWKVLFIIFSSKTIDLKINRISDYLNFFESLLLPLIAALIYCIALPFFSNWVEKLLIKINRNKIENEYDIKDFSITKEFDFAKKNFELEQIKTGNKELEELRIDNEQYLKKIESIKEESQILKLENIALIEEFRQALRLKGLSFSTEDYVNYAISNHNKYSTLKNDIDKRVIFMDVHEGNISNMRNLQLRQRNLLEDLAKDELIIIDKEGYIETNFQSKHIYERLNLEVNKKKNDFN